jgi:hypothetical protein
MTVLPKSSVLLCVLWAKGLNANDIHKEMFPVCGWKCLSRRAVHNWVEKFSQGRSKVADDARLGADVAETTVKRFIGCGFRRTGKEVGQVYQCWWRIRREINAIGIATDYGLDDRGVGVQVPVGSRIFISLCRPDQLWGPTSLLSNGYRGLFPRG